MKDVNVFIENMIFSSKNKEEVDETISTIEEFINDYENGEYSYDDAFKFFLFFKDEISFKMYCLAEAKQAYSDLSERYIDKEDLYERCLLKMYKDGKITLSKLKEKLSRNQLENLRNDIRTFELIERGEL